MKKREKKWTKAAIISEAKKYSDRTEFQKNCPGAYFSAYRAGDIEIVCSHIPRKKKSSKWTQPMIEAEAKKYTSRTFFSRGAQAAYRQAGKLGILDQVCSHMEGF